MGFFRKLLGKPHVDIGPGYLHRWHLIPRNRFFNIYLHHFLAPDIGDLHDHPWASLSVCLKGYMREETVDGFRWIDYATIRYRSSVELHRIVDVADEGCWTLFFTGPRTRDWGFLTKAEWVPWAQYHVQRAAAARGRA